MTMTAEERHWGYRDQRDADVQRGICPDCGTYVGQHVTIDGEPCWMCDPEGAIRARRRPTQEAQDARARRERYLDDPYLQCALDYGVCPLCDRPLLEGFGECPDPAHSFAAGGIRVRD